MWKRASKNDEMAKIKPLPVKRETIIITNAVIPIVYVKNSKPILLASYVNVLMSQNVHIISHITAKNLVNIGARYFGFVKF